MHPRLDLNSWSSCLCLLNSRIIVIQYNTQHWPDNKAGVCVWWGEVTGYFPQVFTHTRRALYH